MPLKKTKHFNFFHILFDLKIQTIYKVNEFGALPGSSHTPGVLNESLIPLFSPLPQFLSDFHIFLQCRNDFLIIIIFQLQLFIPWMWFPFFR